MSYAQKMGVVFFCIVCLILPSYYITALDQEEIITRKSFCKSLITELTEKYDYKIRTELDNPFKDTNDKYVLNAVSLKLINGIEPDAFEPNKPITKQDVYFALKQFSDYISPDIIYDNTKIQHFHDEESINSKALSSIRLLSTIDAVISDNGYFKPESYLNEHQIKDYISRIYDKVKNAPLAKVAIPSKNKVPVLMYHYIGDPPMGRKETYLYVNPSALEQQIKYLADNGYTFLFPDEISYADTNRKSVVITFDDGYIDNFTQAFAILKKYNAKATIHIITDQIDADGFCNEAQLKEMSQSGLIRLYSHTKTHRDMSTLSTDELNIEFAASKETLERITGRKCTTLAFPLGAFSNNALAIASKYYDVAFLVNDGYSTDATKNHELRRVTVGREVNFEKFKAIFKYYLSH